MIGLVESIFRCSEYCSSEIPQFEHLLKSKFGATEFDLSANPDVKLHTAIAELHDIRVGFWAFGTSTRIAFPTHDKAVLGLALQGNGGVTSGGEVSAADRPTLASPHRALALQYGPDLEKIFVSFRSEALKRKLAALLGTSISRDLEFKLNEFTSQTMLNGLVDLIKIIMHQVDNRHSSIAPLALRELEDAAIVQLLFTGQHQSTGRLLRKPPETSSSAIARAEQYIEANWDQPITIDTLTEITGVSGRTLLRSFSKARGYSPMAFARKVRLERAQALLSKPNTDTTVTGVAFACGFSNLGRFAQDYWNLFGELPSTTLNLKKPPK